MKQTPLFTKVETSSAYLDNDDRATIGGIVGKTGFLAGLTAIVAIIVAVSLTRTLEYHASTFFAILIISIILSFIFVLVGRLSTAAARVCSVGYALTEGVFVGTATRIVEEYVSGAGIICVFATLIIYGVLLVLYGSGFLRVDTSKGQSILKYLGRMMLACLIVGITLIIFTVIVQIIRGYKSSDLLIYIAIEIILLFYGVFSLSLSFGEASAVISLGCSKKSEWQVALGMEVSLIYIYIRMLYLILWIAERRN